MFSAEAAQADYTPQSPERGVYFAFFGVGLWRLGVWAERPRRSFNKSKRPDPGHHLLKETRGTAADVCVTITLQRIQGLQCIRLDHL